MLMDELRDKTSILHRATETAFNLPYISASPANYVAMLRTLLSIYRPLERRLDRIEWRETGINWAQRRKTPLLEKDFKALNEPPDVTDSLEAENIPLRSPAAAIGCLYVLEYSTLGAQFILKQIEKTLKLTPKTGAAFFAGYGTTTRDKWAAFSAAADAYAGEDPVRIADAIDSACWSLSCFELSFVQMRAPSLAAV
jgi:heme oxygenase (biliverdin-IX-beta and delta-forming)